MHYLANVIKCIGYSAMTLSEIGQRLRTARKSAQRSQAELAQSLGMSRATISAIENGTVGEIGVRKLMALSTAVGLELSVAARRERPTLQELREQRRAADSGA
jgi:HTH-type transcriptional regulator / antitoxin HipB